jgi:hypothetical protein
MAKVCLENYDPSTLAGDISLVIAGSLGIILSRNSIKSAFVSLEIPRLVECLNGMLGWIWRRSWRFVLIRFVEVDE